MRKRLVQWLRFFGVLPDHSHLRIVDDRGRRVRVTADWPCQYLSPTGFGLDGEGESWWRQIRIFVSMMTGFIMLIVIIDRVGATVTYLGCGGFIVVALIMWMMFNHIRRLVGAAGDEKELIRKLPRVRARRHHCPACEHPLDLNVIEPDGCTLCPHCAAAWVVAQASDATDGAEARHD